MRNLQDSAVIEQEIWDLGRHERGEFSAQFFPRQRVGNPVGPSRWYWGSLWYFTEYNLWGCSCRSSARMTMRRASEDCPQPGNYLTSWIHGSITSLPPLCHWDCGWRRGAEEVSSNSPHPYFPIFQIWTLASPFIISSPTDILLVWQFRIDHYAWIGSDVIVPTYPAISLLWYVSQNARNLQSVHGFFLRSLFCMHMHTQIKVVHIQKAPPDATWKTAEFIDNLVPRYFHSIYCIKIGSLGLPTCQPCLDFHLNNTYRPIWSAYQC